MALLGCDFIDLRKDLEKIQQRAHQFKGQVIAQGDDISGLIVVAVDDLDGAELTAFRVIARPGPYQLVTESRNTRLFAFEDKNSDFRFQPDEKYGWALGGQALDVRLHGQQDIDIVIGSDDAPPPPARLVNHEVISNLYGNHDFHFGTVTPLDDPLLSLEQAKKGMWEPLAFIADGGTGIHFQEPYDAERIPVLFIHGILGSPVNFEPLIDQLDRQRYQAWYVSFPSGLDLATLSGGLAQIIEITHRIYQFEELHLVAHSMGGLATRGALNLCRQNHGCGYLRSFISISTPWGGVKSARSGIDWAPEVVPVWHDLDPESEYVETLFDTPLPDGVSHHLIFGYRQDSLFPNESGDGVIGLSSQLRPEAQAGAASLRGFNEGHVSILANPDVATRLDQLLLDNRDKPEK